MMHREYATGCVVYNIILYATVQCHPLYHRAMEARERTLSPDHPRTLTSVKNLVVLLKDNMGELGQSKVLARRAVEATTRTLGATNPATQNAAIVLYNVLNAKGGCAEEIARLDEIHGI